MDIRTAVEEIIAKLLLGRPSDPIDFIAKTYRVNREAENLAETAFSLISESQFSQPIFSTNLRLSYDILSENKVKKGVFGVNGKIYMELLRLMCQNMPALVCKKLFKRLECRDFEAIPYTVFKSSVLTCCVLKEYISLCENLFHLLEDSATHTVNAAIVDIMLNQLSLAITKSKQSDTEKLFLQLEAAYQVSPDALTISLDSRLVRRESTLQTTKSEFIFKACDLFLANVKQLH